MASKKHYVVCDDKCLTEAYPKDEVYNKNETDKLLEGKANTLHSHEWLDINNKPTTYPPSSHNHDERYYTETECNDKFKTKSDFAVVTGIISVAGGGGKTSRISFPSGFTIDNTYPLEALYNTSGIWQATKSIPTTISINSSGVQVTISGASAYEGQTLNVKVLLVKI